MTIIIECDESEHIGPDGHADCATLHGSVHVRTDSLSGNRPLVRRAADCAIAVLRGKFDVAAAIAKGEHISNA